MHKKCEILGFLKNLKKVLQKYKIFIFLKNYESFLFFQTFYLDLAQKVRHFYVFNKVLLENLKKGSKSTKFIGLKNTQESGGKIRNFQVSKKPKENG